MKRLQIVLTVIVLGFAGNAIAQSNNTDLPVQQSARYMHIPVNTGGSTIPYIIDSQTGRVWRETFDPQHKSLVFVSCNYINIDGTWSKVPNETATAIHFNDRESLTKDIQRATKQIDLLLEHIKKLQSGQSFNPVSGWDSGGNPIYDTAVFATDKMPQSQKQQMETALKQDVENMLRIKAEKEQLLKQFEVKTP
jgi:hypothetical protein